MAYLGLYAVAAVSTLTRSRLASGAGISFSEGAHAIETWRKMWGEVARAWCVRERARHFTHYRVATSCAPITTFVGVVLSLGRLAQCNVCLAIRLTRGYFP